MEQTQIFPFKVTICGLAELDDHREAKVSHVLSILDPETPSPDAFGRFDRHTRLELRFHDVIEDGAGPHTPPQAADIGQLLAFGRDAADRDGGIRHLLVHCHMGISRSTAAAALLVCQAEPALDPDDVIAEIARLRPKAWPNLRVVELGDAALGRRGALIAAARRRYQRMIADSPALAAYMHDCGRGRELI
jgi:predicted protein tyrosine phosphatase